MAENDPVFSYRTHAELVGSIPAVLGYQPDPGTVVLMAVQDGAITGFTTLDLPPDWGTDPGENRNMAALLAGRMRGHGSNGVFIVGYGPHGPAHALQLTTALETTDVPPWLTLIVDPFTATFREFDPFRHEWTDPHPVDSDMGELLAVINGQPALAPSRADAVARLDLYLEPAFTLAPLPPELLALPPSRRIARACDMLEALSAPGPTHSVADQAPAQAMLAQLILSHPVVRDAVITQACQHSPHLDALLTLYRAAPESHRAQLAAIAAATSYLHSGTTLTTQTMLSRAQDAPGTKTSDTVMTLADSVRRAILQGGDPHRHRIPPDLLAEAIEQADHHHATQEKLRPLVQDPLGLRKAAFPSPPTPPTDTSQAPRSGTSGQGPQHHHDPGIDR